MIVAVEDAVTEAVVRKIVAEARPDLDIKSMMQVGGKGNIKNRAPRLNHTARSVPVLIVADLDVPSPCPVELMQSFLGGPASTHMLFRVAVMEIESWVMADREAMATFLGVPFHRLPQNPDEIAQPKELIVSLARRSRRKDIREDLVPAQGSTAHVGPAFNPRISGFVASDWDLERAMQSSPSLQRTVNRLRTAF